MTIRDINSRLNGKLTQRGVISTNTTTVGTGIDTFGYASTMFYLLLAAFTDGSYVVTLEHSDTLGSGYTAVPAANLLGVTSVTLSALDTIGTGNIKKIGCFGTKQFVRTSIVSTGVTTGANNVALVVQEANTQATL